MNNFKTGDKVRCINIADSRDLLTMNKTYTVDEGFSYPHTSGQVPYVRLVETKSAWAAERFEPVIETIEYTPEPNATPASWVTCTIPCEHNSCGCYPFGKDDPVSGLKPKLEDSNRFVQAVAQAMLHEPTPKPATTGYPDNNPKSAVGITKAPLHLVPPAALILMAAGFADGARKYGPYNWRENKVAVSVYVAAAMRHLLSYWDGEQIADDSGVHHLAHAMDCLAIIADAEATGNLVDDRPIPGAAPRLLNEYAEKQSAKV